MTQELIYSEERKTWNLFVDGEWYAEGSYEYCEEMLSIIYVIVRNKE